MRQSNVHCQQQQQQQKCQRVSHTTNDIQEIGSFKYKILQKTVDV